MLNVRNKKAINKLSISSFRNNKLRNIFIIIAISLTTILFTSLFTISLSLIESLESSTMRQVGGSSHGTFKNLTLDEYNIISKHKSIKNIGYSVVLGFAENKQLLKRPSEIRYTSGKWQAENMFAFPSEGRLPENEYEIAADTIVLEKLGIPCKLGEQISLEYSLDQKKVVDDFKLFGFWEGDISIPASEIWISPSYAQNKLNGYKGDPLIGSINADVTFSNSLFIEKKMQKVLNESNLENIDYGVNWAYFGNSDNFDIYSFLAFIAIIILICFSGYLIISNIFYISVFKDIRYYGLLKTIGTTSKQIKKIIVLQTIILCVFGIPIGLIFGFLFGKLFTPLILSTLNTTKFVISINPYIFIFSALFSIFTVIVSITKPSRLAQKVSPIEALRKTEVYSSKVKSKQSRKITMFRMANENIFRNKKKFAKVVISLSLSIIILNCTYSIANSFDMDKYLSNCMTKDFSVADAAYYNVYQTYSNEQTLSKDFLNQLYSNLQIKSTGNIYFKELMYPVDDNVKNTVISAIKKFDMSDKKSDFYNEEISRQNLEALYYGLDDSIIEDLEIFDGKIDKAKFKSGKYILVNTFDSSGKMNYYNIGDTVDLKFPNGSIQEYEVMAIAHIPYPISCRYSKPIDVEFFTSSNEFINNIGDIAPMLTTFDVEKGYDSQIETFLDDYCKNINTDMQYTSKALFVKEFENLKNTYMSVGMALSIILGFIGIMNFSNTVITSLIDRKYELAILKSIGMTNSQTLKMLTIEGLLYIIFTLLFSLSIGSVIGFYLIQLSMGGNIAFSAKFSIMPSIICIPILILISITIPLISHKVINKDSITDRLRKVE